MVSKMNEMNERNKMKKRNERDRRDRRDKKYKELRNKLNKYAEMFFEEFNKLLLNELKKRNIKLLPLGVPNPAIKVKIVGITLALDDLSSSYIKRGAKKVIVNICENIKKAEETTIFKPDQIEFYSPTPAVPIFISLLPNYTPRVITRKKKSIGAMYFYDINDMKEKISFYVYYLLHSSLAKKLDEKLKK